MMTAFVSAPVGLLAGRSTLRPPRSSRLDLHPMRAFHRQPRHEPPTTMLSEADGDGPTAVSGAGSSAVAPTDKGSGGGDRGGLSRRAFVVAAASSAAAAVLAMRPAPATAAAEPATFFDQTASRGGSAVPLRTLFNGKVTLIVNVASYCALTPQYEGLVSLHRKYAAGGEGKRAFDIAAFPCNQFAGQEPGTYEEVCAFAREKFGAAFTLFDPLSVNGPSTHPVYQWLKANNPDDGKRIEWNFAKFLVDGNGAVVRRYKPGVLPEMIEGDVAALVADRPLPKRVKPQLGAV